MDFSDLLLLCLAASLQLLRASADCYNGTHDDVKADFPKNVATCKPTNSKCYEVLQSFSKSHRLFFGCGDCPKALVEQAYKIGTITKRQAACSVSTGSLVATSGIQKAKKFVDGKAQVCAFEDNDGPQGTILCEPGQKCVTAVSATKTRFRGCSSNCDDGMKLSDCRECDKASCDHPSFDASGKFIEKSGAAAEARARAPLETALAALLVGAAMRM